MLSSALEQYRVEFGSLPGSSRAEIMSGLRGRNPRLIEFVILKPDRLNEAGEYLDPWGTPYQFDITDPAQIQVRSFGPNRKDDRGKPGSDDLSDNQ